MNDKWLSTGHTNIFRGFLLSLVPMIFFAIFSSASAQNTAIHSGQHKIVLEYWRHHDPPEYEAMTKLIAEFENINPQVKINLITLPYKTFVNKLAATLATGTGPDLINIHNSWAYSYFTNHLIQPLDPKIFSPESLNKDYFPMIKAFANDKKQYCLPIGAGNLALFYNKDHFKQAGLDPEKPPQSWADLVLTAKKLTQYDQNGRLKRAGITLCSGRQQEWNYLVDSLFPQNQAQLLSPDQTQVLWNSSQGVEAFRWFTDFCRKHQVYSHVFPKPSTAFQLKLASMMVSGNFAIGFLKRDAPDIDLGIAQLPRGKEKAASATLWATCLTKKVANQKKHWAHEFLRFVTTMEAMKFWSRKTGEIPVRNEILHDNDFLSKNPLLRPFVDQMPYAAASLKKNENRYKYYIVRAIERVIIQDINPKEALNEAAHHINKFMKTK